MLRGWLGTAAAEGAGAGEGEDADGVAELLDAELRADLNIQILPECFFLLYVYQIFESSFSSVAKPI